MFKNYYLFKKQVDEILPVIKNSIIFSIYTVHKNELIFDLKGEKGVLQLHINISLTQPYIFISDPVNYKTAKYNLFANLCGQEIKSLTIIPNNKYLLLELDYNMVGAYFFGSKPNIVVTKNDGTFEASFKTIKQNEPLENPLAQSGRKSPQKKEIADIIISANGSLKELTKLIFPSANNKMVAEIAARLGVEHSLNLESSYKPLLSVELEKFYEDLDSSRAFIHRKEHHEMYLLLYKSKLLSEQGYVVEEFNSINKAWKIFNQQSQKTLTAEKLYNQVHNAINRRKKSLEVALAKLKEAENIEQRKAEADLKGNLILTNKHKIPRGAARVELINIFSETGEQLMIKLNPKKTAVENATYYFEKYKNAAEKKQVLNIKKDAHLQELQEVTILEESIANAQIKDLFKIKEQLIIMNILQSDHTKKKNPEALKYAFKRLILENMWDIYIGKNNVNNDLLTFSFAKKSDLWLHAQGVSGSHVIIKTAKSNTSVPKSIIEQAAQIAAANSKAKHSSTVPVIYTEVRYVSKIKKAPPGTVKVMNEKVIFVKPLSLN